MGRLSFKWGDQYPLKAMTSVSIELDCDLFSLVKYS